MKETTWRLGLHLDERPRGALALELWLHADDDPTLSLPVSLLWEAGDDAFAFVRSGDPLGDLERDLAELRPLLATEGIEFDEEQPFAVELDAETVSYFLRDLMPKLDERDVPVALPSAWLRAPTRLRANVTARSEPFAQTQRAALDLGARVVRLAARRRRHGADRRGAARARGGEEPGRAGRRPLAGGACRAT